MPVLEAESPLAKSIAANAKVDGTSIKDYMKGRRDVYMLNPFDIEIEPGFNARDVTRPEVQEHIDNLAKSIKEIGLQRPLKVRMKNNKPKLIDGECRLRATIRAIEVYEAEIVAIPVTTTDKTMTDAEATLALVVENSGLDLNALEKSVVFKRLVAFGWSLNEIAERAGLSAVRVSQLIELAAVPDSVKEMIRNDEIAPTLAWSIAKENDFDEKATLRCIKAAMKEARRSGRNKVTARHVGGRVSFKSSITSILSSAEVFADSEDGEDIVMVTFTRDQFDNLQKLAKINLLG
jgi:ParB family transcriptional regulator, chromosome partitioning protein